MIQGNEIISALLAGDREAIKNVCGEHVNKHLDDGRTPLIVAIQFHQSESVECLLSIGAKVDVAWHQSIVNPWNPETMTTDLHYPLQVKF